MAGRERRQGEARVRRKSRQRSPSSEGEPAPAWTRVTRAKEQSPLSEQEKANRFPLWFCPACGCQRNWSSRVTCHICLERRPKSAKPSLALPPSVRARRQDTPPPAPAQRLRRQSSPAGAASQQASPATPVVVGAAHKEIEARVRALKKDVAHLEAQLESDPVHYGLLLTTAQADLASATEALQRSKPISAQLTSCLSKKVHCDKNVELTAKVMKETDELALVNREAYAAAVKAQSELEEELQRLTLLHTAPAPAGAVPAGAAAALLSALTPSMALQLQLLASLLQGPGRAAILAAASPGLEPSSSGPPQGEGNATPRPSPTTPPAKDDRGAGPGASGSKARSRSPTDRKGDLAGVHHVGLQIDGLTQLQAVLGLFVAECTSVQDNGVEDMKEDEL